VRPSIGSWLLAAAASLVILAATAGVALGEAPNANGQAVVRAVLFYSPTCPHCHQVIANDLPPLQRTYGRQLQIAAVDVSTSAGSAVYDAAIAKYQIPDRRVGVPTLIANDIILVGADEIPDQFPSLLATLLGKGGADWPAIPGLAEFISGAGGVPTLPPYATDLPAGTSEQNSPISDAIDRAAEDPAGSSLSIVILLGLLGCLVWAGSVAWKADPDLVKPPSRLIPPIALVGLAVAAYLASVEMSGSSAICGPVGDCNRVHQSEYATLFGLLPVGVLGVAGYVSILVAWVVGRLGGGLPGGEALVRPARLGLLAMAAFGVMFSAYLTFLEPFVIGATCGWCLASAVLMGATLVIATTSMQRRPVPVRGSRRTRRVQRRRVQG
jgi:uncharacterized membrane protein